MQHGQLRGPPPGYATSKRHQWERNSNQSVTADAGAPQERESERCYPNCTGTASHPFSRALYDCRNNYVIKKPPPSALYPHMPRPAVLRPLPVPGVFSVTNLWFLSLPPAGCSGRPQNIFHVWGDELLPASFVSNIQPTDPPLCR